MRRDRWVTLTRDAEFRKVVRRSVFIAQAGPIRSASQAQDRIDSIRGKYPDATHHVYAWRIGQEEVLQKYSDDGEPSGTAGLPVLDVLRKNDIDDSIIVVTRYFGGTKLGTGGLARAYGKAAAEAVKQARPCVYQTAKEYEIRVDFSAFERLKYILEKEGFAVTGIEYREAPILSVSCPKGDEERLIRVCMDNTSGRSEPMYIGDTEMIIERIGELSIG
ncbi:MAG: YigZ family protein [Clostridiales bacterium]|nr:YigZ family protein [Clostridiales bacterium]